MCGKYPLPCCSPPNPLCIPSESCNRGYCGSPPTTTPLPTATPSCGVPFNPCCSTDPKCISPYNGAIMICQGESCLPETTNCGQLGQPCCYPEPKCLAVNTVCDSTNHCSSTTVVHSSGGEIDFNWLESNDAIPDLKALFKGGASQVNPIVSEITKYLFVLAGLLLLFYLIYGGFHMIVAAKDEKALVEAKGKITNALVGFILLFLSFWIVQILQYVLGVNFGF